MSERVLVWETHHLGDAVMSLPLVRGATESRQVTIVCRPSQAAIYHQLTPQPKVIPWEPAWLCVNIPSFFGSLIRLCSLLIHLRRCKFSIGLTAWADARVHLLLFLTGAKMRVGPSMEPINFYGSHLEWRKRQLHKGANITKFLETLFRRPLLTRFIRREAGWSHMDTWQKISTTIGVPFRVDTPWVALQASNSNWSLVRSKFSPNTPLWIIHPGARTPTKRWPVANYRRLIEEVLVPAGQGVIFIDESQEAILVDQGGFFSAKTDTIPELFSLLHTADYFLGNDSFPAHAAAACGLKVWTIFTSADPNLFAPFGNRSRAIVRDICPFRPCLDQCLQPDIICLGAIDYSLVKTLITHFLESMPFRNQSP